MKPAPSLLALLLALSAVASAPGAARASDAPALRLQACGNLAPFGLLSPVGGFTLGCARTFTLKLGASIGVDGNYILLNYPSCASGPCASLTGTTGLSCHALSGYACCLTASQVVPTIQGTNVALLQTGLSQRIATDSDPRPGICFSSYTGSGARVVNVPLIELVSGNTQANLLGFVSVFLIAPPSGVGTATTVPVEIVSLDPTGSAASSWGQIKTHYSAP